MYSEGKAGWPFGTLGLDEPSSDAKVIKRAYARQLKQVDQMAEAEIFRALRQAYEDALAVAEKSASGLAAEGRIEAQVASPGAGAGGESFEALLSAIYGLQPSRKSAFQLRELLSGLDDLDLQQHRALGFAVISYLNKCLVPTSKGYRLGTGFNGVLKRRLTALFHWGGDVAEFDFFGPHHAALHRALLEYRGYWSFLEKSRFCIVCFLASLFILPLYIIVKLSPLVFVIVAASGTSYYLRLDDFPAFKILLGIFLFLILRRRFQLFTNAVLKRMRLDGI